MNHPQISVLHQLFLAESQPFRRVHRMIDLFECILKTHTVYILSEYFMHNRISDSAKGLLAAGLRTPSLGTWQLFARELFKELQHKNHTWLIPDFVSEFIAFEEAINIDTSNIIALRNGYAHGATPSDEQCVNDIHQFEPFLNKLLQSNWLQTSALEERNRQVFLTNENASISLHPLLLYREEGNFAPFAFFNDLKNDKVGLINYPLSKHYREKEFYEEFLSILPLHEWKKTGSNEFLQCLEELTESFKGRSQERRQLLQFVIDNKKGYFSIQGNPGIGKSALIAHFFKDLRSKSEHNHLHVVEYFIRRGTQQAQPDYLLNYLIRRTDDLFPKGKEIVADGKLTFDLQNQLFSKWRLWGEEDNGKLLFLIDGIDEGVENGMANYLPRENFNNILIIYGSRSGGDPSLDKFWGELPINHHKKLELAGLGKEDIRALIYEVANKYEVERESTWVDAIQQRSQGNPLYLKLLCNAVENGSIELNDIGALPNEINEYYKAILQRYASDISDGDALLNGLYSFAAAKDYLTLAHLGKINNLGPATLQRIGSILKEVLFENPLTEEILDYQLFHESFREYLMREKANEVNDAAERIIDFCAGWNDLENSWEQSYALEHYAAHLSSSKKKIRVETLLKLLYDKSYVETQKQILKGFDATRRMYHQAMIKATELQRYDDQLEAALCLVDLKYEEDNDAPQIVAMLANGEIDLALKRIDSFGGDDEEGVKRKFILIMLCLIELTLLDSKDKPFRKQAIEHLLNHLDDHLPTDHSILNWNGFFPSFLMFQLACIWTEMDFDFTIIYKRTEDWEKDWIATEGPFTEFQFEVLLNCARSISKLDAKSLSLAKISSELYKLDKAENASQVMQEALTMACNNQDEKFKSRLLRNISRELWEQGKSREAVSALDIAISWLADKELDYWKNWDLTEISHEMAVQGRIEQALEYAYNLTDNNSQGVALMKISIEMAKQGAFDSAIEHARGIRIDKYRSNALASISTELTKEGKESESVSLVQEALTIANNMSDIEPIYFDKCDVFNEISKELAKQGKFDKALEHVSDGFNKVSVFEAIFYQNIKQGKLKEANDCLQEMNSNSSRSRLLSNLSTTLFKQGGSEEADLMIKAARELARNTKKNDYGWISLEDDPTIKPLSIISNELSKQGKWKEAAMVMQEVLECTGGIIDESLQSNFLQAILIQFVKQGLWDDVLEYVHKYDVNFKNSIYSKISSELAKNGQHDKALKIANLVVGEYAKIDAFINISSDLFKIGKKDDALNLLLDALKQARSIDDFIVINIYYKIADIAIELAKQSRIEEAYACSKELSDDDLNYKNKVLITIATELARNQKIEEAVEYVNEITSDAFRSITLRNIAVSLTKAENPTLATTYMNHAIELANGISDEELKVSVLLAIAFEQENLGLINEATALIQEALSCAYGIGDESTKINVLKEISLTLTKKDKWELAQETGLKIPQIAQRHACWKNIASEMLEENGWEKALDYSQKLQHEEARSFYLNGWAKNVMVTDVNEKCFRQSLPLLARDSEALEMLIQKYAVREVMLSSPSQEKINQLIRTIDLQWAIDIKNQLPS